MSSRRNPRRPGPQRCRAWDEEFDRREAQVLERNGNLRYVEFEDGRRDWLAPHEVEE
jgi:hypothetical protein